MGFRKGKGTRDAIFQLTMINERIIGQNTETVIQGKKTTKQKSYTNASCIIRKRLIE